MPASWRVPKAPLCLRPPDRKATTIYGPINSLIIFSLRQFSGIKGECQMNAPYCCRRRRPRAHPMAPMTDGWLGKSETLPGKLG
jgi:hypothetical protein